MHMCTNFGAFIKKCTIGLICLTMPLHYEVRTSLQQVSISLCIRIYGVNVACLCWRRPRDLHAGPQPALGGSEDDMVSGDVASDSSDVDVLGGLWLMCACCSIADITCVRKQRWALFQGWMRKHSKERPPPCLVKKVRCSAHGRTFARVRYYQNWSNWPLSPFLLPPGCLWWTIPGSSLPCGGRWEGRRKEVRNQSVESVRLYLWSYRNYATVLVGCEN